MPIYKMDGKKDNKQKYRVFVNYVDGAGKYQKKSKIVYGMDEAKECERLLSSQIKEDRPIAKMTVQNFLDEYIANKKHEVRQSSLEKSQRILKNHIVPHLGTLKLEALNAKMENFDCRKGHFSQDQTKHIQGASCFSKLRRQA